MNKSEYNQIVLDYQNQKNIENKRIEKLLNIKIGDIIVFETRNQFKLPEYDTKYNIIYKIEIGDKFKKIYMMDEYSNDYSIYLKYPFFDYEIIDINQLEQEVYDNLITLYFKRLIFYSNVNIGDIFISNNNFEIFMYIGDEKFLYTNKRIDELKIQKIKFYDVYKYQEENKCSIIINDIIAVLNETWEIYNSNNEEEFIIGDIVIVKTSYISHLGYIYSIHKNEFIVLDSLNDKLKIGFLDSNNKTIVRVVDRKVMKKLDRLDDN